MERTGGGDNAMPWSFVVCFTMTFVMIPYGAAQTQVCVYYENQTVYSYQPYTELKVVVSLNSNAVSGSGVSTTLSPQSIDYVSFESTLSSPTSPDIVVQRAVEMIDSGASPPLIRLTTSLSHKTTSTSAGLTAVTLEEELSDGLQAYWTSTFTPGLYAADVTVTGREYVRYSPSATLMPGENATVQFEAEPSGDEKSYDLSSDVTHFYALLSFNNTTSSYTFGPFSLPVCLDTNYDAYSSVFYQHGFTALTFFVALLVGFLLVVLGVVIYLIICRRLKVSPSKHDQEHRMKEKGKKIVMDPKAALRKGLNVIKDYSIIAWDESIVLVLALKDKLHMFREIDNLDVLATIHMDTDLEQEQNEASTEASHLLIQGLRHNGDISVQTEEAAMAAFHRDLKDLDKKLEGEYKKELEGVYTDLSAKNKERLAELLQKHRKQKQEAIAGTTEMPEKERESLLKLIDRQHQMEDGELTFTLALEQNEGAEKLRKEFAIRKRMGIKELQQNLMSDVISRGQLTAEKADWLMKEHRKQQEAVHRMYDEEISRQRMALEEKLARRRALAQKSETKEDDHTDILNLQASSIMDYFNKGRRSSVVTVDQSEEWMEELKAQALAIKTHWETAKETREEELHKQLSQAKITQLGELTKTHNREIQEYISKNKSKQSEGPVDPVSYVEGLLQLRSQQRLEQAKLENDLDEEHAQRLMAVRQELAQEAQDKMTNVQQKTGQRMIDEGMTEKTVAALVKKHEGEMENLLKTQEKNRRKQEDNLKEELARRRKEWAHRREKERQEQEDLREHEAEIVERLVNSQLSISEAERERIMKEHEKQMVLLENSLTLNKLRQQRSLEERLQQKRAQQMRTLQTQQQAEMAKQRKAAAKRSSEEDDDDDDPASHQAAIDLMKKHAQQRLAVMKGQQLNIDDELEQIRIEMTKGRALALKNQEERLGAMIAAHQMEKAREMTQIEEQQKAINNLKASMMDDLNERGILSTPECERILDTHKQDSDVLHKKMEAQREKQEKMMRAKLQERMQQREQLLLSQHENEMRKLMDAGASGSKFAAKVRRMMLVHKHMVAMEKFRNRLDREISQTLTNTRQQFEVFKLGKVQEEELAFVAGLVRVGGFRRTELLDVLHMLFPAKTEEDIQQILARITEGSEKEQQAKQQGRRDSTIVERIYQALFVRPSRFFRSNSLRPSTGSTPKQKKLGRKSSSTSLIGGVAPVGTTIRDYFPDPRLKGSTPSAPGSGLQNSSIGTAEQYQDRTQMVAEGSSSKDYSQGMDFIAMGASMSLGGEGATEAPRGGILPPLEDEDLSPRRRKKKKRGLKALKKSDGGV